MVGGLLILTISPMKALLFIVFIVVLQQLEGNLIYPKVVGTSIGLPGIWVLAAITVGGGMMGILGIFISVPIAAALYRMLAHGCSGPGEIAAEGHEKSAFGRRHLREKDRKNPPYDKVKSYGGFFCRLSGGFWPKPAPVSVGRFRANGVLVPEQQGNAPQGGQTH